MSLLIGSDKMRLSGDQAGLPGLLSMRVGTPSHGLWHLQSIQLIVEKELGELEENGNSEDGR